jgi:uncharacterized repeat protein (TIGR04138 family)
MPPQHQRPESLTKKTIDQVIEEQGLYPYEAFEFVRRGLTYTVEQVHAALTDPDASRHVSGQQLCEGLRQYALMQWGLLARTVLQRWNIRRTEDFGKIVFTLVESGEMSSTEDDSIHDFRHVYDFTVAFDSAYRIQTKSIETRP